MLETCPGVVTMQGNHHQRPWELARSKVPWEGNGEGSFYWSTTGEELTPGAPSREVESGYSGRDLWPPCPFAGHSPGCSRSWVALPVCALCCSVHPCGLWADVATSACLGLGLQEWESAVSWCLLLRAHSNFPTIKSAVEFECSALCCVSVLD